MEKRLAVLCNKCKSVLWKTGKCTCDDLAIIHLDRYIYIYTDDEDYELVYAYINNDRLVKIVNTILKDLAVYLPVDKQMLDNLIHKED